MSTRTNPFAALDSADRAQLNAAGIPLAEAERQLALFASPPAPTRLVRPCVVGDGIERLPAERHEALRARCRAARTAGRLSKFVPASGAATRMFPSLLAVRRERRSLASVAQAADAGNREAAEVLRFLGELPHFAFWPTVEAEVVRHGLTAPGAFIDDLAHALAAPEAAALDLQQLLAIVLDGDGLDYGNLPKALLPFHSYPGTWRSAFGEHLDEAVALVACRQRRCRLHFTVGDGERQRFARAQASALAHYASQGVALDIDVSIQQRSTDTLAVELDGRPARRSDGTLLLRPGGHGALLANLGHWAGAGGDLVFVKNVDNVVRNEVLAETVRWRELLAGRLLELEAEIHALLTELASGDPDAVARAQRFLAESFGALPPAGTTGEALRRWLDARLDRPLRVCGVVENAGEPGGGPFWVSGWGEGTTRQIVEAAQIDRSDPEQEAILRAATHFNPVDMVLSLRDHHRRTFDLGRYVEPGAAFLATKTEAGRQIRVLEHPGLWNGSMAHWNTVFVEIPLACFAPVKTVFDLLRDAHQPPAPTASP